MEYEYSEILESGDTHCTYGSNKTEDTCIFLHMDDGTTIYCVHGSVNVNQCDSDEFNMKDDEDELHVEELQDFDCCTSQDAITTTEQLIKLICGADENERMDTILESIKNGQWKQAAAQWKECQTECDKTPIDLYIHAKEQSLELAEKAIRLF